MWLVCTKTNLKENYMFINYELSVLFTYNSYSYLKLVCNFHWIQSLYFRLPYVICKLQMDFNYGLSL